MFDNINTSMVFGEIVLDLSTVLKTGQQSLPIIVSTIAVALIIAYFMHCALNIKISTFVGVRSCICGGSTIVTAALIIDADNEEIAQSISVIFLTGGKPNGLCCWVGISLVSIFMQNMLHL